MCQGIVYYLIEEMDSEIVENNVAKEWEASPVFAEKKL